jgi:hypothetical protein
LPTIGREIRRRGEQESEQRYEETDRPMPNNKPLHFPTRPIVMRNPGALGAPHPLSKDYVPPKSAAYSVKDGDNWESVATMHGLSARALIAHNFKTTEQDYVNFYLQRITGCNKTYDDINWAFSGSATPGKVYIPASRDERDPYVRYGEIIPRIDRGLDKKERLAKILHLLNVVGVQGYRRLWYYDAAVVARFLDKGTKHLLQQRMTLFTKGNLPFDGLADSSNWKVYPFPGPHREVGHAVRPQPHRLGSRAGIGGHGLADLPVLDERPERPERGGKLGASRLRVHRPRQ